MGASPINGVVDSLEGAPPPWPSFTLVMERRCVRCVPRPLSHPPWAHPRHDPLPGRLLVEERVCRPLPEIGAARGAICEHAGLHLVEARAVGHRSAERRLVVDAMGFCRRPLVVERALEVDHTDIVATRARALRCRKLRRKTVESRAVWPLMPSARCTDMPLA